MSDDASIPPELEELDRSLSEIRFEPRASLGPELLGRLRRGERPKGAVPPRRFRLALLGVAAASLLVVGRRCVLRSSGPASVVVTAAATISTAAAMPTTA